MFLNLSGNGSHFPRTATSMNQYSQFDVEKKGAVLANNRQHAKTQIAGWVEANPFMARAEADVIVNQVNSNDPSRLEGYVEVAGKKADIIVANPQGIRVNGAGFLNANKTVLSTGKAQLRDGKVTGHKVTQGTITVSGKGLDVRDSNYSALLARSVKVNAGIYKGEGQLDIVAGVNDIDVQGSVHKSTSSKPQGKQPEVAIDTSELGGMYAGSIRLIATEAGVGVNNAGQIHANTLTLDADGILRNGAEVVAQKSHINTKEVRNHGTIKAQEIKVTTDNLHNSGHITQTGPQNLTLKAKRLVNSGRVEVVQKTADEANPSDASQGAPIDNTTNGYIDVSNRLENAGDINSGGTIALDIEQSLSNSGSLAVEYVQLAHGTLSNSGKMVIRQANIQASELTNQDGTLHITQADAFNFTKHIRNSGSITIANGIDWNTQYVHNTGSVYSDNAIAIGAHKIENTGKVISNTTLSLRGVGALDKSKSDNTSFALIDNAGELTAQQYVLVKGAGFNLSNDKGVIGAQDVLIDVASLTGFKGINARRDLGVYTQDDLNIDSDKSVERNLTIASQGNVENSAVLSAGVSTRIESQKGIKNSGTLVSKSQTVFYGETLDNTGRINSQGLTYLHIKDTLDNQATGKIYGHSIVVNARTLTNHASSKSAGVIGGREQVVIGAQYIHNYDSNAKQKDPAQRAKSQALILSGGKLFIGGHINDKGELKGVAQSLVNKGGRIEVLGDADIAVKDIKNLNSHFATESRLDPKQTTHTLEYGELDSTERYIEGVDGELSEHDDNGEWTAKDTWLEFHFYPTKDPQTNISHTRPMLQWVGYEANRLHWWDYTTQVFRDEIVANNPAQMIVGGNLIMRGEALENNKSQIVVGGVLQDTGLKNIDNIDAKGTQSVVLEGTQGRYEFEDWHGALWWYQGDEIYKDNHNKPYTKTAIQKFDFTEDVNVYKDNVKAEDGTIFKTLKGLKLDVSLGGLFNVNTNNPDVLIVTDADFIAQDEQSLNVDKNGAPQIQAPYVPALLENDPSFKTDMHKRIGDSYYEQRLIQEQITQLTGRRFALGYYNDLEQYKALLDNGAQFAQQYNLKAGVALSAEQVARLTTDLVWLENQEVTLADGSTHMVSVPKVYLRARHTDVNAAGSLISAQRMDMSAQTLNNQGVVAGFKSNILKGENIDISGSVVGGSVGIAADKALVVKGGTVRAQDKLFMKGDTVEIASTTSDYGNTNSTTAGTIVDRIAGVYLTGNDTQDKATNNALVIQAQKDLTLKGATVRNNAQGMGRTQLVSEQGSVVMGTVGVTETEAYGTQDDQNYRHLSIDKEHGSTIEANTDIFVQAKDTVSVRQGTINSTKGAVVLQGENGVTIQEGREKERITAQTYGEEYGLLSRTTRKQTFDVENDTSNGSSVTGEKVVISSGDHADVTIRGSNIISDHETSVRAGKDLVIEAAQNTFGQNNTSETKKVGIFGTGGLGFTIGGQKTTVQGQAQQTSHISSVVGNLKEGKTILVAGRNYTQKGSTVNAVKGDVSIVAQNIDISSVHDTYVMDQEQDFAQGGLTVAASIPIVNSLISFVDTARNIGKSKNARVNAMAVANTAYQGYETSMALKGLGEGLKAAKGIKDVAKAFNVSVSVTLGGEYKQSTMHKEGEQSVASLVQGKNTTLLATGGQHSDITITGSDVIGTKRTHIQADHDITLEADAQRSSENSNNSSIGGGIGVSVGTQGFGIHANINGGLGYGVGNNVTHRNTTVGILTGATTIEAGNALTLKGAQAQGKGVAVKANSLHIESLQDSAYYDSKQGNLGLGITVGAGVSGSVNVGFSKTNADHLSVSQQSGILAGDDGFNVNIKDHTELIGGVITSTAKAEADGKNSLTTGTISTSDLDNHSNYKGMSFGMGVSAGITADIGLGKKAEPQGKKGKTGKDSLFVSKSAGFGHEKDRQSSTTQAGIGTHNITVNDSNTNTQQLTTAITTEDVVGSTGLENRFNAEELQKELDVQVNVTQSFDRTRQAVKQLLNKKKESLEKDVKEGKASSKELEALKVGTLLIDGIGGALYTPNANGIIGDVAQVASPFIANQIGEYFKKNGTTGTASHALAHTVLAGAVAAAGGNDVLSAGITAGSAEILAPKVAKWMYGTDSPEQLTEEQKSTITTIVSLGGTALGATTGNANNAIASANAGANAVENNYLSVKQAGSFYNELAKAQSQGDKDQIYRKYLQKALIKNMEYQKTCQVDPVECIIMSKEALEGLKTLRQGKTAKSIHYYEMKIFELNALAGHNKRWTRKSIVDLIPNKLTTIESNQKLANKLRDGIEGGVVPLTKASADLLFQLNTDPTLTIKVDPSTIEGVSDGSWQSIGNGGYKSGGRVAYRDWVNWSVFGSLVFKQRKDGTYHPYDDKYDFDMRGNNGLGNIIRNLETWAGKPKGNGTPFNFKFDRNKEINISNKMGEN